MDGILKNITNIKRLSIAIAPFYIYFKCFGFNGVEQARDFYNLMDNLGPLLYNDNVMHALKEFKLLSHLFKSCSFTKHIDFFKEIDDTDFISEERFNQFL